VAANADEVVKELEEVSGIPIKVLTPEEEAYYVYTGVLSERFSTAISGAAAGSCPSGAGGAPTNAGTAGNTSTGNVFSSGFVIDIGGGSTSLIKGSCTGRVNSCCLSLGCVMLTEEFLKHDPPLPEELQALGDHIVEELSRAQSLLFPEAEDVVIGVGGAVTSIAAISLRLPYYESRHVEGHILDLGEMERCAQELSRLPIEDIEKIAVLGRRRAEIAVAGAFILLLLTCHLNVRRLTVSTRGLRYGLALEAAAHPAG